MRRDALPPETASELLAVPETDAFLLQPLLLGWGAIGLLSLLLRALLLDRAALSPNEAAYAFGAWQASQGQLDGSLVGFGAPLQSYLTTALFFLLGASDAAARIIPVLIGTGLALTPALLTRTLGVRATILAGLLIAVSPIAVQLARVADPASLSALLVLLIVASAIRLLTDRPSWSPWCGAIASGLALASASSVVIALGMATIAALATWGIGREQVRTWATELLRPAGRIAVLTAALVALVATSAGFMDLRGIGFPFGDIWGGVATIMRPAPFPSRNLAALLVYHGPVLVVAVIGFVAGARAGDRLTLFLGEWSLLLIAVAAVFGQSVLALTLLPVVPTALLAGLALTRLSLDRFDFRVSGASWAMIGVAIAVGGVVLLVVAHSIGGARQAPPAAFAVVLLAVALVAFLWLQVPVAERLPALLLLSGGLFAAFTIGTIGRLSFGGSPAGSEILVRQETAPALRHAFDELQILAMNDAFRPLAIGPNTPIEVRWYGRYLPQVPEGRGVPANAFIVRDAPPGDPTTARATPGRVPWTIISQLNRGDLNPLAILRWVVSRTGLVQGQPRDIIVTQ